MLKNILLYTLFRLMLLIAVAALIMGAGLLLQVQVPLLVALILGLLVTAPLSFLFGRSLRNKIISGICAHDSIRKNKRTQLQTALDTAGLTHN